MKSTGMPAIAGASAAPATAACTGHAAKPNTPVKVLTIGPARIRPPSARRDSTIEEYVRFGSLRRLHPLLALPAHHVGERLRLLEPRAEAPRVVGGILRAHQQALNHGAAAQLLGVRRDPGEGGGEVLSHRRAAAVAGIDQARLHPVAASLETVVAVDEVGFRGDRPGTLQPQIAGERLSVGRDRGRAIDRERSVANADLDGAELGLGADVPVEVLHALDDAEPLHSRKISFE